MHSSGFQPSLLKRKRRPSTDQNLEEDQDIENLPTNEEKKYKDDSRLYEPSCSFEREGEKRLPFSELKRVPQDSNIEALVSDQERLSLSEDADTVSLTGSCDVACLSDLSPASASSASPRALTPGNSSVLSPLCLSESEVERLNPLPPLDWAHLPTLWQLMCDKDDESLKTRHPDMFARHPNLQPRMRAVLLDWIAEVCEVYRLHRESYYLTMDFIDRYLSTQTDIPKQHLQLIGITCLQLATKNEEIYPPKTTEYAYVTDGACTEHEIIFKEIVICKALDWRLTPMTPIYWLKVLLQLGYQSKTRHDLGLMFPQYSPVVYARVAHLLDLATLDVGSLRFAYSVLATAALYLAGSQYIALTFSGLSEEDILSCVEWMSPFWDVLKEEVPEYKRKITKLPPGFTKNSLLDDTHNLQKHEISVSMMDTALLEAEKRVPSCLMTPPSSCKKSAHEIMMSYT